MTPELKQEWIAALLSGKYSQGRQYLRREDKFCCLGVLCDIVEPERWVPIESPPGVFKSHGYVGYLPENLRVRVGLRDTMQAHLMAINDEGSSFKDIAAYLEDNLPTSNTSISSPEPK